MYALKAFFSLLTWFMKAFVKGLKLFFVVLPITAISFSILFGVSIYILFSGINPVPQELLGSKETSLAVISLFDSLKVWWTQSIFAYKGQASYILLFILSILMFIPVMTAFIAFSVFVSFGKLLFYAVLADAVFYLLRALIGQSFVHQALSRYYRFFPEAGRKHEEREYDKLLKQRNKMLEEEMRDHRRLKADDFYGDEDDEQDYYPEDEYDDEDDYYPEDDYEDEDDYYPEDDYDDEYEEYDEEYIEEKPSPMSTFDFFAGCTSRESVDKKYRSLVKLYHPDNMDGDTAALQEINVQYDQAKKKWPG
ncbi:hypothetical protein D6855_15395 [Butyrivibrio sp. CB08]|nr:hypothetical protein D6855_15395 [Butyrivibrio sp. CB08]